MIQVPCDIEVGLWKLFLVLPFKLVILVILVLRTNLQHTQGCCCLGSMFKLLYRVL